MRWFIVFSLFFICFSTQAQVVCKDPNSAGGDEVAEAGSSSSLCRTNVTDASQGPVERGEEGSKSMETHKEILTSNAAADETKVDTEKPSQKGSGGSKQ